MNGRTCRVLLVVLLVACASIAAAQDTGYVVFAKHYLERGNHLTVPRPAQISAPLSVFASRGEYEPASFAVRAERDLEAVRVELTGDLLGPDGAVIPADAVKIRVVELMNRWLDSGTFERVECFLIRNRPRDVAADTTQRWWLTVRVPDDAPAGRYETRVRIAPANAEATEIPLRVEVLPLALGRARGMNYFMYFHLSYFPEELRTPEYVRNCYIDMREHGMTTCTVYAWPGDAGKVGVDRDRFPTNLPMAAQMDLLRETGLVANWGAAPWIGAECYGSAIWRMVLDEGRQGGWPEMLWYLVDEPNEARLPTVEAVMGRVAEHRAQCPDAVFRTTTAGAAWEPVSHLYDVWIAGCYIDEATIARGHEMGREIWTYDCGLAPVDAITDRHYFGIWTWAAGLRGASHWAYWDGQVVNRWNLKAAWRDSEDDLRDYTTTLSYIYPKSDEIIPSIGWEAVREGIDDARYLLALEEALERGSEVGLPQKLLDGAQAALDEVRASVHVNSLGEERTRCKQLGEQTGRSGVRDFERRPPEPDLRADDYDRMRYAAAQQLMHVLDALRERGIELDLRAGRQPGESAQPTPMQALPPREGLEGDPYLLEACEDLDKVNVTFAQKHWDPTGSRELRIGTLEISTDEKVQGEGSVHWTVAAEDVAARRAEVEDLGVLPLDYLYGRLWGPIDEVRFHIKCESPRHPPLYALLSASGASPSMTILDRDEATDGWREIVWDVRDAEIGVSERWGKIVWLFRFYAQGAAFEADDGIDLYLDNIRLITAPAQDVSPQFD